MWKNKWRKVQYVIFIICVVFVEQSHMGSDKKFDGIKIGMCTVYYKRVCVSLFLIFFYVTI